MHIGSAVANHSGTKTRQTWPLCVDLSKEIIALTQLRHRYLVMVT